VIWTQGNSVNPDTAGLYHFDETSVVPGGTIQAAPGLTPDADLVAVTPSGTGMDFPADVAYPFFAPHSVRLKSVQSAESSGTLQSFDGDLTIECWFKWDPAFTSGTMQFGLSSGAKLVVGREVTNPANDKFGLLFSHGDYINATGFTNWVDVGDEEAGLGDWRHLGVTIHSTGLVFNADLGHDVYSTGSVARIYLNGHAVGIFPNTIDISGMRAHPESKIQLRCSAGSGIYVDEFTVWRYDWSQNGAISNPFSNGRGAVAAVAEWPLFESGR